MSDIVKGVFTILIMMAVLAYVIISHMNGKSDSDFFLVATVMLSVMIINMVRVLVENLRSK